MDTCTAVIGANVRCGTAWFRRGQALHALGEAEAAVWDLQRAAKLLPGNKQVARALSRAEAASAATKPASPLSAFGGLGGVGAPTLGMGGAPAGGLLGGLMGGMGGPRGAGGGGDEGGLEALLDSPLLAGLGGGGASGLIGFAKTALAYRRRAKLLWRSLKPYLPLLFYAVAPRRPRSPSPLREGGGHGAGAASRWCCCPRCSPCGREPSSSPSPSGHACRSASSEGGAHSPAEAGGRLALAPGRGCNRRKIARHLRPLSLPPPSRLRDRHTNPVCHKKLSASRRGSFFLFHIARSVS